MTKEIIGSIFFASPPVAPPWNEAGKNLVYQLARRLDLFSITLLTYINQEEYLKRPYVVYKKIYPRTKTKKISIMQKISFMSTFMLSNASIYHFFFTPELYSSHIIRTIKHFKRGKFLQTFASPIQNKALISQYVFGDAIVAQSEFCMKLLHDNGVKNVNLIYPSIDTDFFKPGVCADPLRRKYNISDDQKVVLYCGNYYLGCNDDLVQAIRAVTRSNNNVKFILAARVAFPQDTIERERMRNIFQHEGILDRVVFLDQEKDILQLIALSDIHIFPVRKMVYKADIPLVLLESLSMEKPIIITDISPLNEIMKDDAGEIVPPGDVDSLVDSIIELLNNDKIRKEKGQNGREMVIREFGINNYVSKYNQLYKELIGSMK